MNSLDFYHSIQMKHISRGLFFAVSRGLCFAVVVRYHGASLQQTESIFSTPVNFIFYEELWREVHGYGYGIHELQCMVILRVVNAI
jgi:hypothetical protein